MRLEDMQWVITVITVETVKKRDPIKQLEASKSSIKDLFSDLLSEIKDFKYQTTLKVMLKKYKPNWKNWI